MKAKDLRNSILQMAVQGKLVPQDPNDEPASVLLERIRAERAKLIEEKKIKAPKGGESIIYRASDGGRYEKRIDAQGRESEPVCIDDEIPFEIPESWEWCRLGFLFNMQAGKSIQASKISAVPDKAHPYPCFGGNGVRGYVALANRNGRFPVIGRQGALCGCINKAEGEFYATEHAVVVSCLRGTDIDWACVALEALDLNQYATSTAQPGLAVSKISEVLIPVPSENEQIRIMERFSSLTPIINEYGALEEAREALDAGLPGRLRRSVLREAARGALVPQDPSDEPASALLERIRDQRRRLVAEGRLKAPKGGESVICRGSDGGHYEKRVDAKGREGEPVRIDDEIPFEIPESWEWARLRSLGGIVGGGTPKTHDLTLWSPPEKGIPWITPADMKDVNNGYVSHGERYLSEKGLLGSSAQLIPAGSIVMSSRAPIGYLAITECSISTNQGFKSVVPDIIETNEWIMLALDALMDDIKKRASGTTFKEISGSEFGETLIPLPPLLEQKRIVANVREVTSSIG